MKLKQEKGYVGIDVSLAVIALFILVPTIMGIMYAASSVRNSTGIKSEAIEIAVNVMEVAKGVNIENLDAERVLNDLENLYNPASNSEEPEGDESEQDIYATIETTSGGNAVITTPKAQYKLEVVVRDYKTMYEEEHNMETGDSDISENIAKTVTATVTYRIKGEEKSIDLSTVIK